MKTMLVSFPIMILTASVALAEPKGLKFEPVEQERFTQSKNPIVGPTVIDSYQNITWMACAVGQEFDANKKQCTGDGDLMTFQQAVAFVKKIGNGWRIPRYQEIKGAESYVMEILSNGNKKSANKYTSGGWNCSKRGVWTNTLWESGNSNMMAYAECDMYSLGPEIKPFSAKTFGDERSRLILVK